jgi:hypothetical protein
MMASARRRLRLYAAAWLLLQAASLSALVPRDCCAAHAHQRAATVEKPGSVCPLHRGESSEAGTEPADRCTMRDSCAGPASTLFTLFSNQGVLPDPLVIQPDDGASLVTATPREQLICRLSSPDPPPPRA